MGTLFGRPSPQPARKNESNNKPLAAKIAKGSSIPNRDKVGTITSKQLKEIAEVKYNDLNAVNLEGAIRIVEGTARSMGIDVVD